MEISWRKKPTEVIKLPKPSTMSIKKNIIYPIWSSPVLLFSLMLGNLTGFSQNTPIVTQSIVPGSIAPGGGAPVPAYDPGFLPEDIRSVMVLHPKQRDTISDNYHATTNPVNVTKNIQYLGGSGQVIQSVIPSFYKNGTSYQALYQPVDTRSSTEGYSFKPVILAGNTIMYEPNALYLSENYHNTSSRYPEEGGAANNLKGLSVTKVSNTSSATERSSTTYFPGLSGTGQNRGVKTTLVFNKISQSVPNAPEQAAYNIRSWDIAVNGLPVSTGTYAAGGLSGTVTISAEGAWKWVFSDKEGKPVYEAALLDQVSTVTPPNTVTLSYKYAYTYYVYDAMGRLRYVLPPKAVTYAQNNGWTLPNAVLAELCFAYQYDAKGRQYAVHKPGEVVSKVPAYTELVYDNTGRTVLRRSPLEADQKVWEVILYDDKNRVMVTGLLSSVRTRQTWQQAINNNTVEGINEIGYYLWGPGMNTRPTGPINNFSEQSINYYDNYNLTVAQTPLYNDAFSNSSVSGLLSTTPSAEPYQQRASVFGMLTASAIKTIRPAGISGDGLSDWSYSKPFYDQDGRNIYTIHQNASGGKDTLASVYDYMGNTLFTVKNATINLGSPRNIKEQYKYVYEDYSGRLLKMQHRINNEIGWRDLEANTYDELGQLTMKVFGNNAESQAFTYNIRGELKGINEYYALTGNKEDRNIRFGEALRYDYGFTSPKYDGNVAGVVWRGSSALMSSAYAYQYDKGGRMRSGVYYLGNAGINTVPTSWSNEFLDYTEYANYDEQGNITNLQRWGIQVGAMEPPIAIDRLVYTYQDNSNKLQKVVDSNTTAYNLGEFVNGSAQGYTYDAGANLNSDLSKGISNVLYTWFGKPAVITYSNGNTINYLYDAGGNKLGEIIKEGSVTKRLHYISNIVYEDNVAQYMSTPVGRTNLKLANLQEEFLIKDRLGNIRAVIADVPPDVIIGPGGMEMRSYSAGYESAEAATEEQFFDKVSELSEVKPASTGISDVKAALLQGSQHPVGTSILLKVMAGDKIAVNAENFYEQLQAQPEDVVSGEQVITQILNTMAGGAAATTGSEGAGANMLNAGADPGLQSAYEALQATETDSTRPRSYLNYLFFDEHMKLVAEHSRLWQADGAADWKTIGTEEALEIPQNGYIAVYLSNQGAEQVYFDNLAVTVIPGALLDEKHYYPYGLPIKGWGSTASGSLPNRQRYQGNEYREEAGLNWMDFHNRQYDPQLGRFLSLDELADAGGQQVLSPYHAMGCNPALMVDPFGLQSSSVSNPIPGTLLTGGNVPGSSGWGAISRFYNNYLVPASQRPTELQGFLGAMAMMSILSGDAGGAATRMSAGGGDGRTMTSYEQFAQINNWKRQWKEEGQRRAGNFWDGIVTPDGINYYILTDEGDLRPIENHLTPSTVKNNYLVRSLSEGTMGIFGPIPLPFPAPYGSPTPGMAPPIPSWESIKSWQRAQNREIAHNLNKLYDKMAREIDRIYKRAKGPQGYVYELRVVESGVFSDVRGNLVDLKSGDIWKYGESTQEARYSNREITEMVPGGVKMNVIYEGSQIEIKVFEKFMIYGYFFNHNHLPPGNRIFR